MNKAEVMSVLCAAVDTESDYARMLCETNVDPFKMIMFGQFFWIFMIHYFTSIDVRDMLQFALISIVVTYVLCICAETGWSASMIIGQCCRNHSI